MPTLGEVLLRSTLGLGSPPAQVEIGLAYRGSEIADRGYVRWVVRRGDWAINGDTAGVEARFGEFVGAHSFDAVTLWVGGQRVGSQPITPVRVSQGQEYVHDLVVTVNG